MLTVRGLIELLQNAIADDAKVAEMEAVLEGCDCYGECAGTTRITSKGWRGVDCLLIERED